MKPLEKRNIWLRVGVTLELDSDYEERQILSGGPEMGIVLDRLFREGCYSLDGESYIPQVCVEEYNREYGTSYEEGDVEVNL